MRRRYITITSIVALLVAAACNPSNHVASRDATGSASTTSGPGASGPGTSSATGSVSDPSRSTTLAPIDTPVLQWAPCGVDLQCATLVAPLDYFHPGNESVRLPVMRHVARLQAKRIGSLLVNPGGPGFGGTYLAENATEIFSKSILDRFDIVAWDPRGTGKSVPAIDCIDNYDAYFALDPVTADPATREATVAASKAFDEACAKKNGTLLAHISTQDSARDMDLLRRALGEDKISYFGFSYGSELGATWATMFPETVRAAVFDGAVDPAANAVQITIDQAKGFELALNAFLDDCRKKCLFPHGEDPGTAFDSLMKAIHAHSYPTEPGRPPLNLTIAYTAVSEAMYSPSSWPDLDAALDAARDGDGSKLLALNDTYYQRKPDGSYGNELEAFIAISCLDDSGPTTVAGVDAYNGQLEAVAPRLATSFEGGYSCVFWPVKSVAKLDVTGKGAGPIIVIGTTNDPATPFESSVKMARALEGGVFVKVTGNGHTGYSQSNCAKSVVDAYLIKGKVPSADVKCK